MPIDDIHVIHRSAGFPEEIWITCKDEEVARLSVNALNMMDFDDIERWARKVFKNHLVEKHGEEDTQEPEPVGEMEHIRCQFLEIYNEPASTGMDLHDYAKKVRNLAMEGVNMIRPVSYYPDSKELK